MIAGVPTSTTGFVGPAELTRTAVARFTANGGADARIAEAFEELDEVDVLNLLCLPGASDPDVLLAALDYADRRRAFLLVDSPSANVDETIALARTLGASGSANGAIYFPPLREGPLSPAVAGVLARTDVWKAPAGRDAVLRETGDVEVAVDDDANVELAAAAVNAIRTFPDIGLTVWGARTLQGDGASSSDWKYVPVRRLALYIEESLDRGTKWAVFEPNDEPLWKEVREQVGLFLLELWRQGALSGRTPDEAYFVKCGRDTMTQDDLDNGRLNVVIGVAPLRPAEFVLLRIGQWLTQ